MFLFAVTKKGFAQNFSSQKVEEFKIHSLMATIITDRFLSEYIPEQNGFTIIESPLLSTSHVRDTIFSQVTYNSTTDSIIISKSTISGRPIYYHINKAGEFFCSTHISLLRKAGVPITENTDVLPEFFVFRFVMPPNTLYKNINQLFSDGQLHLKITNNTCNITLKTLYHPPQQNKKIASNTEGATKLFDYLTESLKKLQIRKDEMTVLLSGGIDSSILSKICQVNSLTKISYSTKYPFEEPTFDIEKNYSLSAAKALNMDHHYCEYTNQDYLHGIIEAIAEAEEPLHHLQSVLFHLLFKKGIPKEKQLIIHGQGAGTTFGGNYHLYTHNRPIFKVLSRRPALDVLKIISRFSQRMQRNLVDILDKPFTNSSLSNPNNLLWSWMDYGSKQWVCDHFNVTEHDIIKERYNTIKEFENLSVNDIWSLYSLFGDEQMSLSIWSKIGEKNKKILYFPYYDHSVLDYAFSIPWNLKLQRPEGDLRKKLARQAQIPPFIINRPKSSFGVRSAHWAEQNGIFQSMIPLATKILNEKELRTMQSSEPKKAMTLWNMINYSLWKRLCINNEPLEVLKEELRG